MLILVTISQEGEFVLRCGEPFCSDGSRVNDSFLPFLHGFMLIFNFFQPIFLTDFECACYGQDGQFILKS